MVPFGVLLLVGILAMAGGYWAWRYQHRVLDLLRRETRSSPPEGDGAAAEPAEASPLAPGAAPTTATGSTDAAGRVATEARGAVARSVLAWSRFSIVSVVVMDGSAIVACRSAEDEPEQQRRRQRRGGGRHRRGTRAGRSWSAAQWPLLLTTDRTVVLLIGDSAQSERARALLERWQRAGTILWLRPTVVAGGIEFFDGHRSALRAALLAD